MILPGFNNCWRDHSSSKPVTGPVLKVWKIFTTYSVLYFFKTFSAFFCDIYSHTLFNRATSALHLFALVFVVNVFFPQLPMHTKSSLKLNKVNTNSKGLTWYGFKTVFNTTLMYKCGMSSSVILIQFKCRQLNTKIGYCRFLIFASS